MCALDLFAGVGSSSCTAAMADANVLAAIDIWPLTQKKHLHNSAAITYVRHLGKTFDMSRLLDPLQTCLLLSFSKRTNQACKKIGGEPSEETKRAAFRFAWSALELKPRWVVIENFVQIKPRKRLALGYNIRTQGLNAADSGVPQELMGAS